VAADLEIPGDAGQRALEWIPIRPNTDTAVMLALTCETILANRHDEAFLYRYCTGFERWRDYLLGRGDGVVKNADWAAPICGVPAERIRALAAEMAGTRSLVNVAWSVQRA
ncbi:MAG TPA: molybdopterin-dependent oxidoreductase, partial [Burkholderiaceae bacterium]|nr:molybdopterin-dependent oxidoreductase [Burkholderiaceae bacterium]